MAQQRKLLVLGPIAQAVMVLGVLAASLLFYSMGDRVQCAVLVGGLASHWLVLLPIARGRPSDIAPKVVTRTIPPPPPPIPREKE